MDRVLGLIGLMVLVAAAPAAAQVPAISEPGQCTTAAALGMPESGKAHDHNKPAHHQGFFCRIRQVDFQLLQKELTEFGAANSKLGELDVKRDIAAIAVQEPIGGVLFFDVSDPGHPRYLSQYRHARCGLGNNCGAYVEMTADGKWALLAVQQTDLMPGLVTGNAGQSTGVALIDLRDPKKPALAQEYATVSVEGVHTARSHVIAEGQAAGEYAYVIQNGVGIEIARLQDTPAGRRMVRVANIALPDATNISSAHDTFIQTDPIDKKTYLYAAGGFTWGFRVFDVSNPATPLDVATWDPTPECLSDWYAHTVDVTHRGNRRYVTLPAEQFSFGAQSAADQANGCGKLQGNGDRPGTMWIIDASDFSKLATVTDSATAIKEKSLAALKTTWNTPSGRATGQLTFSAHNQQIVGDRIYLSHYHGGVFVLDAANVFAGGKGRPKEIGWALPSSLETRPQLGGGTFPGSRQDYWDMNFYKDHIIAADINGGLYSLVFDGDSGAAAQAPTTPAPGCTDRTAPVSTLRAKLSRRGAALTGTVIDAGCDGTVARVFVAVGLHKRHKCRWLSRRGRLGRPTSCRKPSFLSASGTVRFSLRVKGRLPRGSYTVAARAIDGSGNLEQPRFRRARVK